jgi:multidrug transporter EmrE-like cation transporter
MTLLFFSLISIVLSVAAQFLLKAGMSSSAVKQALNARPFLEGCSAIIFSPYVISGFLLYGLGALIWLMVLSRWDVSKAYPLVGLGFVLAAIIGLVQGENISSLRIVGIALIVTGVAVVARS